MYIEISPALSLRRIHRVAFSVVAYIRRRLRERTRTEEKSKEKG